MTYASDIPSPSRNAPTHRWLSRTYLRTLAAREVPETAAAAVNPREESVGCRVAGLAAIRREEWVVTRAEVLPTAAPAMVGRRTAVKEAHHEDDV